MRAIVTGMVVTYPVGGVAWDYLQYALGLEQLGFEVFYLEDTGWQVYDPQKREYGEDSSYGVAFLRETLRALSPSLERRWHVRGMNGATFGLSESDFADVVHSTDVFLNVSGGTLLRDEYMRCPRKVLIDTDPGWNHFVNFQKWDANPGWLGTHGWRAHDHFFTYAERIGRPDCTLPTLSLAWQPTRPPVVLDRWSSQAPGECWTTVMTWNNFGNPIEHRGVMYGTKEREFEKIESLPSRVNAPLEIAVGGAPPIDRFKAARWLVRDSQEVARTARDYQHYVQQSRGELSVAKNVYVATNSGWFSCRSVCYLAAGRPAVLQDTGFSEIIRADDGIGLLPFSTLEEAVDAVGAVESDYSRHARGARRVAEQYFDSRIVLSDLLQGVGLA